MMRKSAILISIVLLSGSVHAQVDSLLQLIRAGERDTTQVDHLKILAEIYLEKDLDSSFAFASQGLALALELDYSMGQRVHNNVLGNYYQRRALNDSALYYYDKVVEISEAENDTKGLAVAYNNIAIVYTKQGELPQALELYQKAFDYELQLKDTTGMAEAYNNIGVIHYYMGDVEKTLEYFEKSVELSELIDDRAVLKKGYNNLGALYDLVKNYEKALDFYQRSYDLAEELGQKKEMGLMLNNIGTAYSGMKDYQNALVYFGRSLELRKEIQDLEGQVYTTINIAGDLYQLGDESGCETRMADALDITLHHDLKYLRAEIYGRYMAYRKDQGRWKEALEYSELHQALSDSLLNEERVAAVTEMETKFETEQKEKELEQEKARSAELDRQKAEAELAVTKRNAWLRGTVIGIIGLIFLGLFLAQRNRRRADREMSEAVMAERDKGFKAVLRTQEEERTRISRDLHDSVGQQLSGLKMGINTLLGKEGLSLEELKPKLEKLEQVVDETTSEVRVISHQMMPKVLSEYGLSAALKDMLEKSLGGTDITYSMDELRPIGRLDSEVEVSLYRIAQEVVNNIIKHSQASEVDIQLYSTKDQIVLIMEDNGRGFVKKDSDGHGLSNIRNRTRIAKGSVDFESESGKGTSITVRIPIHS